MANTNYTFNDVPFQLGALIDRIAKLEEVLSCKNDTSVSKSETLLNINQASQYLDLSKPCIYAYVQKEKIPFYKKEGKLYFIEEELINWIKTGKVPKSDILKNAHTNFLNAKKKGGINE